MIRLYPHALLALACIGLAAPARAQPSLSHVELGDSRGENPLTTASKSVDVYRGATTTLSFGVHGSDARTTSFTATGLPPGVTAQFRAVDLNHAALDLTAASSAKVFDGGAALLGVAGNPRTLALTVRVRGDAVPVSGTGAPVTLVLPPCTEAALKLLGPSAGGAVGFKIASSPPDVTASISADGILKVRRGVATRLPSQLSVAVSVGGVTYHQVTVDLTAGTASLVSISPASGHPPERLDGGTGVTFYGAGFCPDAKVTFPGWAPVFAANTCSEYFQSNKLAPVDVTLDASGTSLMAIVPRYAMSGPLKVLSSGGSLDSAPFTVVDYRATNGFCFQNNSATQDLGGGLTWDFGDARTAFGSNACLVDWPIIGCIPDPLVLFVTDVLADLFLGAISHGLCWGFVRGNHLIRDGKRFADFADPLVGGGGRPGPIGPAIKQQKPEPRSTPSSPAAPPTDIWDMPRTRALASFLHGTHYAQMSLEFLVPFLSYNAATGQSFIDDLHNGISGGGVFLAAHQHVVDPYDVETLPDQWIIHVYNPDVPYLLKDPKNPNSLDETDASHGDHAVLMARSTLRIDRKTLRYCMNDGEKNHWEGSVDDLNFFFGVVPMRGFPREPTPIVSFWDGITAGLTVAGLATLDKLLGAATGGSTQLQITDASGNTMFNADGSVNTTSKHLRAKVLAGGHGGPVAVVMLSDGGRYTYTVTATRPGPYTLQVFGPGFVFQLASQAGAAGVSDRLRFDRATKEIELVPGGARPVALKLAVRTDRQTARTVTLTGTATLGSSLRLSYVAARNAFRYAYAGPAATRLGVALEQQQRAHASRKLDVAVAPGDETHLEPDWSNLPAGGVMRVRAPSAPEVTRPLP